ncbi:class I SAM-dependent methyltransferase [Lactobacillus sp. YT155]|uniref:class I SAM-dependent DNA methyltransferase n=1 Tax=Lactobacillus sp. YT155 TaxID=3060955 RepID=UPI00265F2C4F|nr:class I SAM-dependent methyltransferase [Lactobacillus sp. YT155]MDO1605599.1 class I SAM-dependent methyltransferase [Lactobacillus sp. YT155]
MIYAKFAEIYNELMDDSLYEKWSNYVQQRSQKSTLLELACGTGDLAILLKKAGYEVTATDLSIEMLEIAAKKIEANNEYFELAQLNMLDLSPMGTFDTITCFDDSICYLSDKKQLQLAFNQAYEHLTDNGKYLFDAHSLYQMDEVFPGYMYNFKNENSAFMWSSYEGEVPHSIEHDLTFFDWNEDKQAYDVSEELHKERTYELEVYLKCLKKAGFKDVKVTSDFGNEEVNESSTRWFFECSK